MAPGIFFFFFKAQELFLFSFLIGFLSLPHPQFPRFLSFQAMSYLKMFTLNETRPVYSLKPDAFEHYSRPQQINITTFPYRLFAIAKTL